MKDLVKKATELFIKNDFKLLQLKVYEPAVSHRIAVYIENIINFDNRYRCIKEMIPNIDCEYNKNMDREKLDREGCSMRPDILVHSRLEKNQNLIAIEIKKHRTSNWDESKLKTLTNPNGEYHYQLGVFIYFPNNIPQYRWFIGGKEDIGHQ